MQMLDRTIPFCNLILKCSHWQTRKIQLPDGYSFEPYREGYERAWAVLEHEIGDFDSVGAAERYFAEAYLVDATDLAKRSVFLINGDGAVVGSCLAWRDQRFEDTVASLHWLVVAPEYQGLGLGRSLCEKTMQLFFDFREFPVYLHTQPWSWKAVLLYVSLGFKLQKTESLSHYENQYGQAIAALRKVMDRKRFETLIANSEP